LLLSVGQTSRQKSTAFVSTKQFQSVSTERLLIRSNWRWYLLQRIARCSHIRLFYRLMDWGPPKYWGPWL